MFVTLEGSSYLENIKQVHNSSVGDQFLSMKWDSFCNISPLFIWVHLNVEMFPEDIAFLAFVCTAEFFLAGEARRADVCTIPGGKKGGEDSVVSEMGHWAPPGVVWEPCGRGGCRTMGSSPSHGDCWEKLCGGH